MATMYNPYQAQTPIGQALQNVAGMMFASAEANRVDPLSELDLAQMDYYRARTANEQAALAAGNRTTEGQAAAADLLARLVPTQGLGRSGPPGPLQTQYPDYVGGATQLGALVAEYGLDAQDYADLYRFQMANSGAPDDVLYRALLGAGQLPGLDNGMSMGDREGIRATNAQYDLNQALAEIAATPLTESQVKGGLLSNFAAGASDRDIGTIVGAYNAPSYEFFTGPGGEMIGVDQYAPYPTAGAIGAPAADGSLGALFDVMPLGSSGDSDMTAYEQNLATEAAQLGISTQELAFVKRVESQAGSMGGVMAWLGSGLVDQSMKDAYNTIAAKMVAARSGIPVPDGLTIEP